MTEKFGKKLTRYALMFCAIVFLAAIAISFLDDGAGIILVGLALFSPIVLFSEFFFNVLNQNVGISFIASGLAVLALDIFAAFFITKFIESKDGPLPRKDFLLSILFWLGFTTLVVAIVSTPIFYIRLILTY